MKKDKIEFKVIQKSRIDRLEEQGLSDTETMALYGGADSGGCILYWTCEKDTDCTKDTTCIILWSYTCPSDYVAPCPSKYIVAPCYTKGF